MDRFDEMLWVVVLSEGFIEVTEFMFSCLSCATMCVYAIGECFKAAGFVLCVVVAIVVQYLVGVGVFSVYFCSDGAVVSSCEFDV